MGPLTALHLNLPCQLSHDYGHGSREGSCAVHLPANVPSAVLLPLSTEQHMGIV